MIIKKSQEHLLESLTLVSFSEAVEEHKRENKIDSYLSAVISLADEMDLDEKDIVKLLSPTLIDKIRIEAIEDGLLIKEDNPMFSFL